MSPSLGFQTQLVQICFFLHLQLLKQPRGPQASVAPLKEARWQVSFRALSYQLPSFSFSCQECQCYHPLPGPLSPGASLA